MKPTMIEFDSNHYPASVAISEISTKEQKILKEFEDYCLITASKARAQKAKTNALRFLLMAEKNIDKIDLRDLRNFLKILNKNDFSDYYKNDIKGFVQKFLKWYFPNWSETFSNFEDIKINARAKRKKPITEKDILSKHEVEKLMKAENSIYWKTFLIVQYEGGLRTKECRTLRWDMIEEDNEFSFLNITSIKNKDATAEIRIVPLKSSTRYLNELKNYLEANGRKSVYVFPSIESVNNYISSATVNKWLKRLTTKVIGRSVNNYLLRHTRGTELKTLVKEGKLSKDNATDFLGHSEKMFDKVYSHMDREDVKEILKKQIYDFDEIPEEKKHELEKQLYRQQEEIIKLKNSMKRMQNFDDIAVNLFENKKVQEALLQVMIKKGLGKKLLEISGK
jgi:integrase